MGPPGHACLQGWGGELRGHRAALQAAGSNNPSELPVLSSPSSASLVSSRPVAHVFLEAWAMVPLVLTPMPSSSRPTGGGLGRGGWGRLSQVLPRREQWDPHPNPGSLGKPPDSKQSHSHLCSARITVPKSWFRVKLA